LKQVTVTVPGKIMLAGEYSVLRGGSSLASTIDQNLTIAVSDTSNSGKIEVSSSLWDELVYLDNATTNSQTEPLLESTAVCRDRFKLHQASVSVDDGLKVEHGVGSSSALRFGVLLGFESLFGDNNLNKPANAGARWDLARECFMMQKSYQKHASGYDIATQNIGGLVVMQPLTNSEDMWPGIITKLSGREDNLNNLVSTYVSEVGAPTKPLMNEVLDWLDSNSLWNELNVLSSELITNFIQAIDHPEIITHQTDLISAVRNHREFFRHAPGFPRDVLSQLKTIEGFDKSWSFKTTGAGGQDAILIVGSSPQESVEASLKNIKWCKSSYKFSPNKAKISLSQETVH